MSRAYKVGFKWDHLVRKIGFGRHCRAETAYKVEGEKTDLVRCGRWRVDGDID